MKEDKFIKDNSETWVKLEGTLKKLKSKGISRFGSNELNEFISLYNSACGHLSYSRTNYGNSNTTAYLNKLVAAAHSYIYTNKLSSFKKFANFFLIEFPLLFRKNIVFFIITTSIFFTGFFYSFICTMLSDENASAFIPESFVDKIINDKSGEATIEASQGATTSSMILTNNITVGITAFAEGVTIVGTVLAMLISSTSTIIGSIGALALKHGTSMALWPLLLPHGVIEMFCIFLCGAAGLKIGIAVVVPGKYSRKDSIILKGKEAIRLLLGAAALLVVAGLIEGFFTPMRISPYIKLYFALFTLVLLLFYLIFPNIYCSRKKIQPPSFD